MRDNTIYTEEMSRSVWDKSFFMDKIIGADVIVDFGCANGAMICYLAPLFPEVTFIGYDIDDELINMAIELNHNDRVHFFYGNQLSQLIQYINHNWSSDKVCLNFSSVLHEVFSNHSEGQEAIQFLVSSIRPRYITIRDMYFNCTRARVGFTQLDTIVKNAKLDENAIEDFEHKFGSILNWKNLIHFLIKYQWINNGWEEELEEDYFSLNFSNFGALLDTDYRLIFNAQYTLPYLTQLWKPYRLKTDFFTTHGQFILERKG